jgi:TRAP-type mannitol/chloroaromatic compound transport system permease small subunit
LTRRFTAGERMSHVLGLSLRAIDAISEWSGKAFGWLIVPLMGALAFEVISRYFFRAPTTWAYDMSYMLYSAIFMLGAAYTLRRGEHVRTDFLYRILPVRWQGVIDALLYIVFLLPPLVWLTIVSGERAYHAWLIGERAMASLWQPPVYPFRAILPLGLALLALQVLAEAVRSLFAAVTGRRP